MRTIVLEFGHRKGTEFGTGDIECFCSATLSFALGFPNGLAYLSAESLLSGLPVDDIPDGGEVLGLAVLVLQAVSAC